jgi:hypothetical protein
MNTKDLKKLNRNENLRNYDPYFFKKGSLIHGGFTILDETTVLISLYTN